jgi:uncharacterized protein (DUF2235 family)
MIGSSFDQHVGGGWRFMMRFYTVGDQNYIFGFSRGAYIARFLAEMLDHFGLLSHGNEEMVGGLQPVAVSTDGLTPTLCTRPVQPN